MLVWSTERWQEEGQQKETQHLVAVIKDLRMRLNCYRPKKLGKNIFSVYSAQEIYEATTKYKVYDTTALI